MILMAIICIPAFVASLYAARFYRWISFVPPGMYVNGKRMNLLQKWRIVDRSPWGNLIKQWNAYQPLAGMTEEEVKADAMKALERMMAEQNAQKHT
jgi:hypothetical protein